MLVRMLSLYALAAFMMLIPAYIIGEITNFAADHQLTAHRITLYVGVLVVSSILGAGLSFFARRRSVSSSASGNFSNSSRERIMPSTASPRNSSR